MRKSWIMAGASRRWPEGASFRSWLVMSNETSMHKSHMEAVAFFQGRLYIALTFIHALATHVC